MDGHRFRKELDSPIVDERGNKPGGAVGSGEGLAWTPHSVWGLEEVTSPLSLTPCLPRWGNNARLWGLWEDPV